MAYLLRLKYCIFLVQMGLNLELGDLNLATKEKNEFHKILYR